MNWDEENLYSANFEQKISQNLQIHLQNLNAWYKLMNLNLKEWLRQFQQFF